ncbi:MAG: DUF1028 domain-containing protein [Proteobacteria bacterium]|nr:DUF1028 domain-containing protein [Pseudomonadota bacterium]
MALLPPRRFLSTLVLVATTLSAAPAFATWSIVAVDRATGRISMATASCVDVKTDHEYRDVTSVIIPGIGIAACQAGADRTLKNQKYIFEEMKKGTDPHAILEQIARDDPDFQQRQFGLIDIKGRMASHTGLNNGYVAQVIQGQVPGTEIFYSVQANTMRPGKVVPNAVAAFIKTEGALTDRVMAAMDAADGSGGDARCSCPPYPTDGSKPAIACSNRVAHAAWIVMADPKDKNGDSVSNGDYSLYLTVLQPGPDRGSNQIQPGEDLNAETTLRMRYDAWRKLQSASYK